MSADTYYSHTGVYHNVHVFKEGKAICGIPKSGLKKTHLSGGSRLCSHCKYGMTGVIQPLLHPMDDYIISSSVFISLTLVVWIMLEGFFFFANKRRAL